MPLTPHLQVLEHLLRVVDAPYVQRQALLPGLHHQAVGDHALLRRQKVDVVAPDALVDVPGGAEDAVAHPPLRVGGVKGLHAGVVQGHEHGPVPETVSLHQLRHRLHQGLAPAGGGLELDEQAHAALPVQLRPDHLLQGGDGGRLTQAPGGVGPDGQRLKLRPRQIAHAGHLTCQPPEAVVVDHHRHPVGGELHVDLRVVRPSSPASSTASREFSTAWMQPRWPMTTGVWRVGGRTQPAAR